jgi:hypothetical protein
MIYLLVLYGAPLVFAAIVIAVVIGAIAPELRGWWKARRCRR